MKRLTSNSRRKRTRAKFELKRQAEGRRHQVHYFHQLDDPYSHLAAQKLAALVARFDIDLLPHLVGEPPADAVPENQMLKDYAKLDASRIAPFYNLTFDSNWQTPSEEEQLIAARFLTKNHCSYLGDISTALWSKDRDKLNSKNKSEDLASAAEAKNFIAEGTRMRKKLGHYSGAMFYYEGEWYWGIDRLPHLERRLSDLGARRDFVSANWAVQRHTPAHGDRVGEDRAKFKLEYFPSLRSPYTFLSIDETLDLPKHYPVELIVRPVMPMVMRGLKVPPVKGFYIFMDSKREADIKNIGFGRFKDPVGPPVLRGFSVFPYARDKGKGGEYLQSFLHAAFAERIDVYSKKGLRKIVSRVGLDWSEVKKILDNEDWHDELEENRKAMFAAGCWGVPSYRLLGDDKHDDFSVWGNDRIWLLKEEIARRLHV